MDKIAEITADMDAARERFEDNVLDHIWKRHGECELYYGAHSYMQTAQDRFDAMHSELEREQGVREDAQRQLRAMHAEVEAANERAEYWRAAKASDFYPDAMRFRWIADGGMCPFAETDDAWGSADALRASVDAAAAMQGGA